MIVRMWKTAIDADRAEEFESFARTISLPMFRQQPGCIGVLFARTGAAATTISFWKNQASIDRLAASSSYQETVREIEAAELLQGDAKVELYPIFGGHIDLDELAVGLSADSGES